jgi:hypothetical protein
LLALLLKPVSLAANEGVKVRNITNALRPLFDKAAAAHESEFKNLSKLDEYRERFHQMTRNVQVR